MWSHQLRVRFISSRAQFVALITIAGLGTASWAGYLAAADRDVLLVQKGTGSQRCYFGECPQETPETTQPPVITIVRCKVGKDQFFLQNGMAIVDPQNELGTMIGSAKETGDSNCPVVIALFNGKNFCIAESGMIYVPFQGTKLGFCEICDATGRCKQ